MLRPLALGEILDAGIKVVSRNWKPLVISLLIVTTPVQIISVFVLASVDDSQNTFQIIPDTSQPAETPGADFFVAAGVTALLSMIALLLAYTALFKGVSDAWLGARPTIRRSLAYGVRRAPAMLALFLLWIVPMAVFVLPCGIPALWLGTVWSLSIPALLFERTGPLKALGRSYRLIQGRFWASLLMVIVCVLLVQVLGGIVQLPLRLIVDSASDGNEIANAIATVVGSMVGTAVGYPYMAAVLTILYFDQRVRKEGFDIQLLADGLGVERDPDAPLPAPPAAGMGPPPAWQPPSPGWAPAGWAPPSAGHAPPPSWKPAADERPPEDSPWMSPAPREGGERPLWGPPSPPSDPEDEPPASGS
jgi:hypothetical protein